MNRLTTTIMTSLGALFLVLPVSVMASGEPSCSHSVSFRTLPDPTNALDALEQVEGYYDQLKQDNPKSPAFNGQPPLSVRIAAEAHDRYLEMEQGRLESEYGRIGKKVCLVQLEAKFPSCEGHTFYETNFELNGVDEGGLDPRVWEGLIQEALSPLSALGKMTGSFEYLSVITVTCSRWPVPFNTRN